MLVAYICAIAWNRGYIRVFLLGGELLGRGPPHRYRPVYQQCTAINLDERGKTFDLCPNIRFRVYHSNSQPQNPEML